MKRLQTVAALYTRALFGSALNYTGRETPKIQKISFLSKQVEMIQINSSNNIYWKQPSCNIVIFLWKIFHSKNNFITEEKFSEGDLSAL